MMKVIKLSHPDCKDCMGASYDPRDCAVCTRAEPVVLCKDCKHCQENVMWRTKNNCGLLHAWVEPFDFCSWGDSEVEE